MSLVLTSLSDINTIRFSKTIGVLVISTFWLLGTVRAQDFNLGVDASFHFSDILDVPVDDYETVLETKGYGTDPVVYISQLSPVSPFGGTIVVNFTVSNSADLQMYLTHIATGATSVISTMNNVSIGSHQVASGTSGLPSGNYQITVLMGVKWRQADHLIGALCDHPIGARCDQGIGALCDHP